MGKFGAQAGGVISHESAVRTLVCRRAPHTSRHRRHRESLQKLSLTYPVTYTSLGCIFHKTNLHLIPTCRLHLYNTYFTVCKTRWFSAICFNYSTRISYNYADLEYFSVGVRIFQNIHFRYFIFTLSDILTM